MYEQSIRMDTSNFRGKNTLFVGNLSYFCDEQQLKELMQQYGEPLDVEISRNRRQSKSLLFGFVTMPSVIEAEEILHLLNGHLFMGRNLR